MNSQGKIRLDKWYTTTPPVVQPSLFAAIWDVNLFHCLWQKDRERVKKDMRATVLKRKPKECNFLSYKEYVVVYKRYV